MPVPHPSTKPARPRRRRQMTVRSTHWLICAQVTKLLCERGANLNARDSWGYTPLQRAATNDCVDAAKALLAAGASLEISSGLDGDGDNAYELAKRLRSYDCIFAFDDHIAAVNT